MKNKILKKTAAAMVVSSCLISGQANAFLITTDFPALAESMYGHMQDAMAWAEEKSMSMMEMDMQAMFEQLASDQADNLAAFDAFNSGRRDQEIQNKEIEKEMAGNFMEACDASALSKGFELSFCSTIAEQQEEMEKESSKSLDTATSLEEFKEKEKKVVDELEEMCLGSVDFEGKAGWDNVAKSMTEASCFKSDLITGQPGQGILSEKEYEDAKKAITLLVHNIPEKLQDYTREPDSDFNKQQRVKGFRKQAFKNVADKSLREVVRWYAAGDGVGLMNSLHEFNSKKYGDPCWITKFGGAPKDGCKTGGFKEDNKLSPQILREVLLVQGFMSNVAVHQYEQQLRMEALMAALLAIEVEPLK